MSLKKGKAKVRLTCACGGQITEELRQQRLHSGWDVVVPVMVPVLVCLACGGAFTDGRAEEVRKAVIRAQVAEMLAEAATTRPSMTSSNGC